MHAITKLMLPVNGCLFMFPFYICVLVELCGKAYKQHMVETPPATPGLVPRDKKARDQHTKDCLIWKKSAHAKRRLRNTGGAMISSAAM